jgi:hypothetical protein
MKTAIKNSGPLDRFGNEGPTLLENKVHKSFQNLSIIKVIYPFSYFLLSPY